MRVDGNSDEELTACVKYNNSASAFRTSSCNHASPRRHDSLNIGKSVTQNPKMGQRIGRLKKLSRTVGDRIGRVRR